MTELFKLVSYRQRMHFLTKLAQDEYNFRMHVLTGLACIGEQMNELSRSVDGMREVDYTAIQDAISDEVVDTEKNTTTS